MTPQLLNDASLTPSSFPSVEGFVHRALAEDRTTSEPSLDAGAMERLSSTDPDMSVDKSGACLGLGLPPTDTKHFWETLRKLSGHRNCSPVAWPQCRRLSGSPMPRGLHQREFCCILRWSSESPLPKADGAGFRKLLKSFWMRGAFR